MRYVTELACEHSCPLPSNLNSVHQATGQPRYPHKFPRATGQSLSAQEFASNWKYNIRTSSLEQLDNRYPHKNSQATGYRISAQVPSSNWTLASAQELTSNWTLQVSAQGFPTSNPRTESHPRPTNRSWESGRPGLCPVEPISSGLLMNTLRHLSGFHTVWCT